MEPDTYYESMGFYNLTDYEKQLVVAVDWVYKKSDLVFDSTDEEINKVIDDFKRLLTQSIRRDDRIIKEN
tara:strand:- start:3976 stop:4185 length:210 start_codon:yes stop_codon:yes gene_type:complete